MHMGKFAEVSGKKDINLWLGRKNQEQKAEQGIILRFNAQKKPLKV